MSSLDMVAYINATREPGKPELRHDDFMRKVPSVIGLEATPKFIGMAFWDANGAKREQRIYNFPKREAMLMSFPAWKAPGLLSYSFGRQQRQLAR